MASLSVDAPPEAGPSSLGAQARALKRKRSDFKETISHGTTASQSIGLVRVDPVYFGSYEIRPWFTSPYILQDPAQDQGGGSRQWSGQAMTKSVSVPGGLSSRSRRSGANEPSPQREKAKLQPRNPGGRFTPKAGAPKDTAGASVARRRSSAAAPPLQLSLRSRAAGPSVSDGQAISLRGHDRAGSQVASPDFSSVASTAPLDSPQLAELYEPGYVASRHHNGAAMPVSGAQASHVPAEPSPLSQSLNLPSPSAPTSSKPPTHSDAAPSPGSSGLASKALAQGLALEGVNLGESLESSARLHVAREAGQSQTSSPTAAGQVHVQRGSSGRFSISKPAESKRAHKSSPIPKRSVSAPDGLLAPAEPSHSDKTRKLSPRATSPLPPAPASPTCLFVCDACFKYFVSPHLYSQHKRTCNLTHPPGRKVYQRGAHIIWEVDGAAARLYCQCLCLFGKLFIDHKYIFFDVEGFHFYVLTEATPSFDHVLGFFSKEKMSYDGYNLACIVTFPPYQKRGYGTLLIEFSYELDRHGMRLAAMDAEEEDGEEPVVLMAGTPERPLSDLGAKGYFAFWTSALVRCFRKAFEERKVPQDIGVHPVGDAGAVRRVKGFEGELARSSPPRRVAGGRPRRSVATEDVTSPPSHGGHRPLTLRMTLGDIARATSLRTDDAAFALVHSGLAKWRGERGATKATRSSGGVDPTLTNGINGVSGHAPLEDLEVVVTPDLVEEVAARLRVKRAVVDRQYLLL